MARDWHEAAGQYNLAVTDWGEKTPLTDTQRDTWMGLMRDLYQIEQKVERFILSVEYAPRGLGCVCQSKATTSGLASLGGWSGKVRARTTTPDGTYYTMDFFKNGKLVKSIHLTGPTTKREAESHMRNRLRLMARG